MKRLEQQHKLQLLLPNDLVIPRISELGASRMNDTTETTNQNNDSDSGANVGMHGVVMKRGLEALRESIAIQCADGNLSLIHISEPTRPY